MKYKPGVVIGGKHLVHDCGLSRSIGYFLEPLILLGLFGKKPLSIRLKGSSNQPLSQINPKFLSKENQEHYYSSTLSILS